ncbi:MAG: hypothetical protein ACYDC1_03475 [Limisphaerales bacterium]
MADQAGLRLPRECETDEPPTVGLFETIPTNGLPVVWRAEVRPGYVGPAVVGNSH